MAFDEFIADRIRRSLKEKSISFSEKKMMGGLCFIVDNKMLCGLLTDKNTDSAMLMARIGLDNYENALKKTALFSNEFQWSRNERFCICFR